MKVYHHTKLKIIKMDDNPVRYLWIINYIQKKKV